MHANSYVDVCLGVFCCNIHGQLSETISYEVFVDGRGMSSFFEELC